MADPVALRNRPRNATAWSCRRGTDRDAGGTVGGLAGLAAPQRCQSMGPWSIPPRAGLRKPTTQAAPRRPC
jgi:hypothetical protein